MIEENQNRLKLIHLKTAKDIIPYLKSKPGEISLALAGYSNPPKETYEPVTRAFLESLVDKRNNKILFVLSPTTDPPGSIDHIGTIIANNKKNPVLYITANTPYCLDYIIPDKLPDNIDKTKFMETPKYTFPDMQEYSKATAESSDAIVVNGGRDASVSDFVNAICRGNKAIILDNKDLGDVNWDEKKGRPNNAACYLIKQIEADKAWKPLPYPECKGFTLLFLKNNTINYDDIMLHKYYGFPDFTEKNN